MAGLVRLGALLLVACSVDHRALQSDAAPPLTIVNELGGAPDTSDVGNMSDGDAGGAPATGAETSGQGGAPATGAEVSGQGGAPSETPPDTTDVPPPTTATSWTFDSDADVGAWEPEDGVDDGFSTDDADGSADSGSMLVTDTTVGASDDFVSAGTAVCVPVAGGVTYDIAAALAIDAGQSAGSGGFNVQSFDGASCDGALLDLVNDLTVATGGWQVEARSFVADPAAHSALFRLVVSKRTSDPPFAVHFDDVRLAPE